MALFKSMERETLTTKTMTGSELKRCEVPSIASPSYYVSGRTAQETAAYTNSNGSSSQKTLKESGAGVPPFHEGLGSEMDGFVRQRESENRLDEANQDAKDLPHLAGKQK